MSKTGANEDTEDFDFEESSDPFYYEADGEGDQIYLDSVLPQAYDPTLEPFDTKSLRPREYPEQNEYGFHDKLKSPYHNIYNNTDFYFNPQNRF
tara:strand:- start:275 stop:556 length:282 start_codon:yes stop_codon:yes gene_type:complete